MFNAKLPYKFDKVVCRHCHVVIEDWEPMSRHGEFYHQTHDREGKPRRCPFVGVTFRRDSPEVEPFLRKRERRNFKRQGRRAAL